MSPNRYGQFDIASYSKHGQQLDGTLTARHLGTRAIPQISIAWVSQQHLPRDAKDRQKLPLNAGENPLFDLDRYASRSILNLVQFRRTACCTPHT
jgi:hypothetical protein